MTIDEAIEILNKERKDHHSFPTDIIGQAQQLGIEALKREKGRRQPYASRYHWLLPGETIEEET